MTIYRSEVAPLQGESLVGFDLFDECLEPSFPFFRRAGRNWLTVRFQICTIWPLIPDIRPVLHEIANVRVALEEPEKLVNDRVDTHFLRGEQGKACREIESHLRTENASRPGACAIGFDRAFSHDPPQKIEVDGVCMFACVHDFILARLCLLMSVAIYTPFDTMCLDNIHL